MAASRGGGGRIWGSDMARDRERRFYGWFRSPKPANKGWQGGVGRVGIVGGGDKGDGQRRWRKGTADGDGTENIGGDSP